MSRAMVPLGTFIQDWGADDPTTVPDLVNSDPDSLSPTAQELRRQITSCLANQNVARFGGAREVSDRIRERHIIPKWKTFDVLALDKDRRRVMKQHKNGSATALRKRYEEVPVLSDIETSMSLPVGGVYLVFYWGSPTDLDEQTRELRDLKIGNSSVADLIIWTGNSGDEFDQTVFSVRAQQGERNGDAAAFHRLSFCTDILSQDL
jgi:hypothetical protein